MRYGTIECACGCTLYFETEAREISCLQCGEKFDISDRPIKVPESLHEVIEGD